MPAADNDDPEAPLSRLTGSPAPSTLGATELATVEEVEPCCAAGPLPLLPLLSLAALSLAFTRAASASRSEAASLAAMRAIVSGDCWGGGRGPAFLGRGRREVALPGERVGDSGAVEAEAGAGVGAERFEPEEKEEEVEDVAGSVWTVVLTTDGGCFLSAGEGLFLSSWGGGGGTGWVLLLLGDALADLFGRGGGGMSVDVLGVGVGVGGSRDLELSAGFDTAVRADEEDVAAVALVGRCLVTGLVVGTSFLGCSVDLAAAARVTRVAGFLGAGFLGAGASFLTEASDRVDLAVVVVVVVLLEALETEVSGEGFTLSSEESELAKTPELGLEVGFSSCESVETLSLF